MTYTLPLTEQGNSCGMVELWDEGCYRVFSIDVPRWGGGLKKVWLMSDRGGKLLLGTLQPEGSRFRLCRKISHSALRCCGLTAPTMAAVNPTGNGERPQLPEGWQSLDTLTQPDEKTAVLLRQQFGGMWQNRGQSIAVRYPWKTGDAVPVVSLFRYGQRAGDWWEIILPVKQTVTFS